MNSPIKYFGGKSNMFNNIMKYFPEETSYNTYIEPFGGSFSIGLKMKSLPPVVIYNDLEMNVTHYIKSCQITNYFHYSKINVI